MYISPGDVQILSTKKLQKGKKFRWRLLKVLIKTISQCDLPVFLGGTQGTSSILDVAVDLFCKVFQCRWLARYDENNYIQ